MISSRALQKTNPNSFRTLGLNTPNSQNWMKRSGWSLIEPACSNLGSTITTKLTKIRGCCLTAPKDKSSHLKKLRHHETSTIIWKSVCSWNQSSRCAGSQVTRSKLSSNHLSCLSGPSPTCVHQNKNHKIIVISGAEAWNKSRGRVWVVF